MPLKGLIQPVFLKALSNSPWPTVLHGFPAGYMPAQEQCKSQIQPWDGDLLVRFKTKTMAFPGHFSHTSQFHLSLAGNTVSCLQLASMDFILCLCFFPGLKAG